MITETVCVVYVLIVLICLVLLQARWNKLGRFQWQTLTWQHVTHDSRGLGPLRFGLLRLAMSIYTFVTLGLLTVEVPVCLSTFTIWCWMLIGLYLATVGVASLVEARRLGRAATGSFQQGVTSVAGCFLWVWFETMFSTAILVFLIVWLVLLPYAYISTGHDAGLLRFLTLSAHNLNVVFMGIEMLLNRLTFIRRHAIYVLFYGLTYVVFSWCYFLWGSAHKFWYFFLDWRHAGTPIWYTLLMLIIWGAFAGGQWCVTRAKARVASELPGGGREVLPSHTNDLASLPS